MPPDTRSKAHIYFEYSRDDSGKIQRGRRVVVPADSLAEYPHAERLAGWPEPVVFWAAPTGTAGGLAPASTQARAALEPLRRVATIDLASGFVWWVGDAEDPADACARSHAETGNTPAEFVACTRTDGAATYAVHEVPAGFDVEDGQQAAAIAATEAHPLAGYFRQA